jgi:hypothetical protein
VRLFGLRYNITICYGFSYITQWDALLEGLESCLFCRPVGMEACVFIYIYLLFDDAVSRSDYKSISSGDRIIGN